MNRVEVLDKVGGLLLLLNAKYDDMFLIKPHIIMLFLEKITISFCVIAKTHDSLSLVTMLA